MISNIHVVDADGYMSKPMGLKNMVGMIEKCIARVKS